MAEGKATALKLRKLLPWAPAPTETAVGVGRNAGLRVVAMLVWLCIVRRMSVALPAAAVARRTAAEAAATAAAATTAADDAAEADTVLLVLRDVFLLVRLRAFGRVLPSAVTAEAA